MSAPRPGRRRGRGRGTTRRRAALSVVLLAAATLLPASAAGVATEPVPAAGRPVHVVGLGDSVTAGTACDCTDFVTRLSDLAPQWQGTSGTSSNHGVAGLTSSGLAELVQTDPGVRNDIRQADVVLITIGANDLGRELDAWPDDSCAALCAPARLDDITTNIEKVIEDVRVLRDGRPTRILVTTYWNVFVDGAVARRTYGDGYLAWSDRVTRAANAAICSAASTPGAVCVDLYTPFKGTGGQDPTPLLAADGDHPSAAGHALIAATLAAQAGSPRPG